MHNCKIGTYSDITALPICRFCPKGKYGIKEGGTSAEMACKNCSVGSFAQADGSKECYECPAGSHCNIRGLSIYTPCSAGKYNSYSNQTTCLNCPRGTYISQMKAQLLVSYAFKVNI